MVRLLGAASGGDVWLCSVRVVGGRKAAAVVNTNGSRRQHTACAVCLLLPASVAVVSSRVPRLPPPPSTASGAGREPRTVKRDLLGTGRRLGMVSHGRRGRPWKVRGFGRRPNP